MRKLRKLLMVMVMMFTMMLSLASCSNSSNTGNTGNSGGGNETDLSSLTSADVFKNIEADASKITYAQLSGSSAVNYNSSNMVKIKAFASYKFEVLKITAKFQSTYESHTTNDGYDVSVYDTASFETENEIKSVRYRFKNSEDYNRVHTIEIEFTSGELVLERNKGLALWLSASKSGYTIWSNIEIIGKVIA